jgi:hypothetical protein
MRRVRERREKRERMDIKNIGPYSAAPEFSCLTDFRRELFAAMN